MEAAQRRLAWRGVERLTPGEGNRRGRKREVHMDHVVIGRICVMVETDDANRSWGKHEWWSEV